MAGLMLAKVARLAVDELAVDQHPRLEGDVRHRRVFSLSLLWCLVAKSHAKRSDARQGGGRKNPGGNRPSPAGQRSTAPHPAHRALTRDPHHQAGHVMHTGGGQKSVGSQQHRRIRDPPPGGGTGAAIVERH